MSFLPGPIIPIGTRNQLRPDYGDTTPNAYSNAYHRTYDHRTFTATHCSSTPVFRLSSSSAEVYAVTRVGALYSFEPTKSCGLAFVLCTGNIRMSGKGSPGYSTIDNPMHLRPTLTPTVTGARLLVVFRDLFRDSPQQTCQPKRSRKLQCSSGSQRRSMLCTLDPANDKLADNALVYDPSPKIVRPLGKYSQRHGMLI